MERRWRRIRALKRFLSVGGEKLKRWWSVEALVYRSLERWGAGAIWEMNSSVGAPEGRWNDGAFWNVGAFGCWSVGGEQGER